MMKKIIIKESPSADTRSATHKVTQKELEKSSVMHISDVAKAMKYFADKLEKAGDNHDWTKLAYIDEFYEQFEKAQETGDWGIGWYDKIHIKQERHHINDNPPNDVDLIDVLEQIADGVMAGLARTGEYCPENISPDLLMKAYKNTVDKLIEIVEVKKINSNHV